MNYLDDIDHQGKFTANIVDSLKEKVQAKIDELKTEITDDMFMGTILEEDLEDYLAELQAEGIEYTIEDDIIVEKTSGIVRRNKSGSGLKSRKLTRVIKPCAKGETRVGKRGCRKGTTGKSKKKARKSKITKRKNVSRTVDGKSKKRNKAIGKGKAQKTRSINKRRKR